MRKILLVSTDVDFEVAPYEGIVKIPFLNKKAFLVPLHIATIAALTSDDIEVDLWDEPVHGRIDDSTDLKDYDLVGITGYVVHLRRAKEIAQIFRRRGIPVAIGGPGVSSAPERCRDFFDILFIGEAEYTWPQFIADWKAGNYRNEYRQITKPPMEISPLPRWDSLTEHLKDYALGAVQTTRGCPFDCEFCDVIYLFGRRPRHKPISRVLEEVSALQNLGVERIFFCDDNFIGNIRYTKHLLKELIALNNSFQKPMQFQTQATINLANDEELLELMADANFGILFIGIESPNKEALKETNKLHNYRSNLVEDLKKIMSYGMAIKGGMIVGFDEDTPEIFGQQFEFLQEACVPIPTINLLKAPVGTKLWARLRKEGRLLVDYDRHHSENLRAGTTNIIPKQMTRVELLSGYLSLIEKLSEWPNFEERIKGFVSDIKRQPNIPQKSEKDERPSSPMGAFANLPTEARRAISGMFFHTLQHAPFMLEKVLGFICVQLSELAILEPLKNELQEQIELEKSGAANLEIDQGDFTIPEGFMKAYPKVFPEIHKQVYLGLLDKKRVDEILVQVFTDFLIRWGETFEKFEEYYRTFLFEIVNRAIDKENSGFSESEPLVLQEIPDIKKSQLANEVLKCVEQELREIRL